MIISRVLRNKVHQDKAYLPSNWGCGRYASGVGNGRCDSRCFKLA